MVIRIDQKSEEPLYLQIRSQIIAAIATGELVPGTALPSVRALASDLGINLHTVNKAYAVLRDEGPAFDPTTLVAADVEASLEDRHIGGLGVHFVKKLADRFVYRRDGAFNETSVSRTLSS